MAVYKDKNGTWYVSARYDNWQGEHARKVKRGFKTKNEIFIPLPQSIVATTIRLIILFTIHM